MSPKVSVFIIAFNSEKKIAACLRSVKWADEVVVVDSGSLDQTASLVKENGAALYQRKFTNFSEQKNYAMSLCKGDWVLSIDSDEVVTDALREEIQKTVTDDASLDGYRIPRQSVIFSKEFRYTGMQDDQPVRLMRAGKGLFEQPIHEFLNVRGATGILKGALLHFTYDDISDYFERFNRYTTKESEYLLEQSFRLSWVDFFIRPPAMFIKLYFFKQGFRDGFPGFLFSVFSGFYVFVKYAKYRDLSRRAS